MNIDKLILKDFTVRMTADEAEYLLAFMAWFDRQAVDTFIKTIMPNSNWSEAYREELGMMTYSALCRIEMALWKARREQEV